MSRFMWAVGVTTVPERQRDLLPETLRSLGDAGFPPPWLFVDGHDEAQSPGSRVREDEHLARLNISISGLSVRNPRIFAYGNWWLGLMELYVRRPSADYYLMVQDDVVFCRRVRQYLERQAWPSQSGYLSLYTAGRDQLAIERRPIGWCEGSELETGTKYREITSGEDKMQQGGDGALALLFDRAGVQLLLKHQHMVDRPSDVARGRANIDGGVVNAFNKSGWRVWVHNPSLCQHKGERSTISGVYHRPALSFPGENFDALELLESPLATADSR